MIGCFHFHSKQPNKGCHKTNSSTRIRTGDAAKDAAPVVLVQAVTYLVLDEADRMLDMGASHWRCFDPFGLDLLLGMLAIPNPLVDP